MKLFSANVFIATIAAVASLASSECEKMIKSVGFEVRCSRKNNNLFKVYIMCRGNDWNHFRDVNLNVSGTISIEFRNCSFPATFNVQNLLNSMKIKDLSQISFYAPYSIPNRQNLRGLSSRALELSHSNITEVPFDLLYDVLGMETLIIAGTNITRIPEAFFSDWAENITDLQLETNKLQKIGRDDFARLVNARIIDLTNNEIEEIEPGAFSSLVHVDKLKLRQNRLHTLPYGIFHQLGRMTELDLSENSFDELPQDLLVNTKNLETFYMDVNKGTLVTLPRGFFKNLIYLDFVRFYETTLKSLPADLFAGCSTLENIDLSANQLTNIPLGLFDDTKNLKELDISKNCLESLPAGIFKGLRHLEELDISTNQLTSLTPEVLKDLQSVETFNTGHNNLTQIDGQFFTHLKSARYVDLSHNQLTFESRESMKLHYPNVSSSMNSLNRTSNGTSKNQDNHQINLDSRNIVMEIDLSYNRIAQFNAELMNIIRHCEYLDLSNNQISKINLSDFSSETLTRNKTYVKNQTITEYVKITMKNNPLHCDCNIMDFVRCLNGWRGNESCNIFEDEKFRCASPPELKDHEIKILRLEELSCLLKTNVPDDACSDTCICREYPEKQILTVDCSRRNLTHVPPMITNAHNWSIELNMSGNVLQDSPTLRDYYLTNVTSLDLSYNNIIKVTSDLFSPNLQQLKLHGNSISRLDDNVIGHLERINTLSHFTLHDNKWICDCDTRRFLNFVQQKITNYNFHEIKCHGTNQKLYKMSVSELCEDVIVIIVVASLTIAFLGLLVASLIALYYKNKRQIKVWLYSKQWCLWFVTEEELDKDKEYDAFISFSHKDEEFVEKEIVAKLEEGPRPYKLCLHYRDWLAGEWIPVQISRSVEASRRTVVVLTPNFLESVWGLMEFRAAHTQALKEGRTRLIVIICGEIGNIENLDQEMQDYLRLNTYIKWGDPWFWDKLKYALPHAKEPMTRKSRNVEVSINHPVNFPLTDGADVNVADKSDNTLVEKYTTPSDSVTLLNSNTVDEHLTDSSL